MPRLIKATCLLISLGVCTSVMADEQFKDVEVRVIKNKSFQKRMRLEAGANMGAIMNKSFVYTYIGSLSLGFHITESFGVFGEGGYAFTANKADCTTLGDRFLIEPIISQLNWLAGGGLSYTPIYGKYQLASGDVIYYDWYFTGGGGIAGVKMRGLSGVNKSETSCIPAAKKNPAPGALQQLDPVRSTTQLSFMTGQRIFVDKNLSVNWNLRWMVVQPPVAGATLANGESNMILAFGVGYFL